ncbi:MAG: hypothetical protein ACYC2G_17290 [Gemmatimonadaceae bacterium]
MCDLFDLPALTERDRNANSLLPLLSLAAARTDTPTSLPAPATSGFFCNDGILGLPAPGGSINFPSRTVSTPMGMGAGNKGESGERERPISPSLRSLLPLAARRLCAVVRPGERRRIRRRVLGIRTQSQAQRFLSEARSYLKAYKTLQRKPPLK